jgi:hypothetical protein
VLGLLYIVIPRSKLPKPSRCIKLSNVVTTRARQNQTLEEEENAFECFAQQFQLYQERYTEQIAASTAASTEAQSEQHPQATGKQSAPKRRKLAHPKDEADVALLSTGLFYVEEEDAAPDAEIAA